MSEGLVDPCKSSSEAGANLFWGGQCAPWALALRVVASGKLCPQQRAQWWDDAQPTVRYLTWPIRRRPGAKALPLRSHVSASSLILCRGFMAPSSIQAPLLFRDEDFYKLFQSKPRPALPPRFRSGTSVKPAHKCWLFHTVTTFVPSHTLHLLSESHQVFPFVRCWISASEATSGYLTMEATPNSKIWWYGIDMKTAFMSE